MPHYRPYKIHFTLTSLSLFPFHISPAVTRISTLRKKCPYSDLFWSAFFRIRTEYGEIRSISLYSVQIRENADQNNSEYGHFSHSAKDMVSSNNTLSNTGNHILKTQWIPKCSKAKRVVCGCFLQTLPD